MDPNRQLNPSRSRTKDDLNPSGSGLNVPTLFSLGKLITCLQMLSMGSQTLASE